MMIQGRHVTPAEKIAFVMALGVFHASVKSTGDFAYVVAAL